jgi:hypothetical protein
MSLIFVLDFAPTVGSAQTQANAGAQALPQPASVPELAPIDVPFQYVSLSKSPDVNAQFYLTAALAIAAGFDEQTAIDIGLYNQYVDDNPRTSPRIFFNFKARRDYHFTSVRRRERLWQKFLAAPSAQSLGIYLHALQDAFEHKGYGWILGHFWKGERPDQSWRPENAVKADAMASACYQKTLEAARFMGVPRAAVDYRQIAAGVGAFLRSDKDDVRSSTFTRLMEGIAREQGASQAEAVSVLEKMDQTMQGYASQLNLNHARIHITAFAPGVKLLLHAHH